MVGGGTALIRLFSPASLGVYIIHVNYFVWRLYIDGYAKSFAGGGVVRFTALVMLSSLLIYIVLSLVDIVRIRLFRLLHIDDLIALADKAVK